MTILKKYKFAISVIIGILLGLFLKEKALVLRPFGTIFVNLIFTIIVPLIFIIISKNIIVVDKKKNLKKLFIVATIIVILTLFITGIFTEISLNIYNPYGLIKVTESSTNLEKINLLESIVNMITVNNFAELFNKSNILALIIIAILFGLSINYLSKEEKIKIKNNLDLFYKIIIKLINIIMLYAPIGICAYVAALIGEYGKMFISQYLTFIIMYIVLGILNILIFHTLYLFLAGGIKLVKNYYKNIFNVIITAFSTQSSVVTMPTNIKTLENMEVNNDTIGICTPVLTLVNMQGNVIQNVMKLFLMASLFSLPLKGINYITYILLAILAGSITAGIPGGGVISNTLLVSVLGVSPNALPILITIEWLLDAPATVFNVLSDTATIPLIDKVMQEKGSKNVNKRKK